MFVVLSSLSNRRLAGAFGLLVCLFVGCRSQAPVACKLQVPFILQEPQHCGAAALSMLLSYYEVSYSQVDLRKSLYVPFLNGTTPELIVDYARRFDLDVLQCRGTVADLQGDLAQGRPIIALWGRTEDSPTGHFVVVTGYNARSDRLRVHDGLRADRWMGVSYFMSRWALSDYTMIRVISDGCGF